jgi:hypothetical protein
MTPQGKTAIATTTTPRCDGEARNQAIAEGALEQTAEDVLAAAQTGAQCVACCLLLGVFVSLSSLDFVVEMGVFCHGRRTALYTHSICHSPLPSAERLFRASAGGGLGQAFTASGEFSPSPSNGQRLCMHPPTPTETSKCAARSEGSSGFRPESASSQEPSGSGPLPGSRPHGSVAHLHPSSLPPGCFGAPVVWPRWPSWCPSVGLNHLNQWVSL